MNDLVTEEFFFLNSTYTSYRKTDEHQRGKYLKVAREETDQFERNGDYTESRFLYSNNGSRKTRIYLNLLRANNCKSRIIYLCVYVCMYVCILAF